MVFSYTTTGATNRGTIFRGDVAFISGTWNGSSTGTVVTGGSVILAHDVTIGSAAVGSASFLTGASAMVISAKNQTGTGASKNGAIKISQVGCHASGDWWAVTRI